MRRSVAFRQAAGPALPHKKGMSYTLHFAPDNASLIIRLALEQLGQPYHTTLVDRVNNAQRKPAYLALNPNGLIPVLETPQGPIFETGAILLWLGDRHGEIGVAPDHPARADYLKWLFYIANTLHPALRMMFYPDKYIPDDTAAQTALRQGLHGTIKSVLHQLDALAATPPAGFNGTLPDALQFYLAGCLRWCALYPTDTDRRWFGLNATPALARMCAALEARPCTHALQTAEGLGATPFTAPDYANPPQGSAT